MVDIVVAIDPEHYHQISQDVGRARGVSVVLQQVYSCRERSGMPMVHLHSRRSG